MSERILISNARLVDPASGRDEAGAIGIDGERIAIVAGANDRRLRDFDPARTIDARGAVLVPGWSTSPHASASLGTSAGLLESELAARLPAASRAWSARPTPTPCSTSRAWSRCSSSALAA